MKQNQKEVWKDIDGYKGSHQVNNYGAVRSLKRVITREDGAIVGVKERTIKPTNSKGYLRVTLCKDSQHKVFFTHRLVAFAFIPNPENKPFINHIDGVKSNNYVNNLEWCTQSENFKHAFRLGLKKVDRDHRKTTWGDVKIMREMYVMGAASHQVAMVFPQLTKDHIKQILSNTIWIDGNYKKEAALKTYILEKKGTIYVMQEQTKGVSKKIARITPYKYSGKLPVVSIDNWRRKTA